MESPPTPRIHPRTHGGPRPNAGAKPGPHRATIERQARLYALFNDEERALLAHITPLDIIEVAARRFLANGELYTAAHIAALAAPYRHQRRRIVLATPADAPAQPPATPTPLGGFGGVPPEPLRKLELTDPTERTLVLNRIPRRTKKHKRCAR